MDIAQQIVGQVKNPVLIGSSMGGYYANYLAERYACRAVLVNPAVRPYELLRDYFGPQTNNYTGETFTLGEAQMAELKKYDVATMQQPGHRLLMVQSEDETLDFRQATSYFSRSPAIIEQGGNHSFTGFEKWLPAIAAFLQL